MTHNTEKITGRRGTVVDGDLVPRIETLALLERRQFTGAVNRLLAEALAARQQRGGTCRT